MKNVKLKVALFENGMTQRELSRATGIQESLISLAIHGRYLFDKVQKEKVSGVLGRPAEEIFGIDVTCKGGANE